MKSFWMTFTLGVLWGLGVGIALTYASVSWIVGP